MRPITIRPLNGVHVWTHAFSKITTVNGWVAQVKGTEFDRDIIKLTELPHFPEILGNFFMSLSRGISLIRKINSIYPEDGFLVGYLIAAVKTLNPKGFLECQYVGSILYISYYVTIEFLESFGDVSILNVNPEIMNNLDCRGELVPLESNFDFRIWHLDPIGG